MASENNETCIQKLACGRSESANAEGGYFARFRNGSTNRLITAATGAFATWPVKIKKHAFKSWPVAAVKVPMPRV